MITARNNRRIEESITKVRFEKLYELYITSMNLCELCGQIPFLDINIVG